MTGRILSVAALAALCLASATTHADESEAVRLFNQGVALLKQGELAQACDKFDQSNDVESTLGSLLRAADCREQNGQTATAWRGFAAVVLRAQRPDEQAYRREAQRRAARLEPGLPQLEVTFIDKPPGAVIVVDDRPLPEADWRRVAIDPGPHRLTAAADGRAPYSVEFVAVAAERTRLLIPALSEKGGAARRETPEARRSLVAEPAGEELTGVQIGGLIIGSIGAAGLVTGAALGGVAMTKWNDVVKRCRDVPCDDPNRSTLHQEPLRFANLSTGFLAAGGTLLATGVVLWFVGASDSEAAGEADTAVQLQLLPSAAAGYAGAELVGTF